MPRTATKQRSSPARRARGSAAGSKRASKVAESKRSPKPTGAKGAVKAAKSAVKPKPVSRLARMAALKALKFVGRKVMEAGTDALQSAADRTATTGRNILDAGLSKRPPVQSSLDVAVPTSVAWEEWMTFGWLNEGVHRIEDVERDGDCLIGRTAGPRSTDWEAEITDERDQEAFAWRSVEGSDCAGLVTFHRLGDRLTRVEVDLDVLPRSPAETLLLSTHIAHRRVETELRRFKAAVEFINPDVYEPEASQNGSGPDESENESP